MSEKLLPLHEEYEGKSHAFELVESATKRKGVLATYSGPHFFPETASRNKRKYTKGAWEGALADENVVRMLDNNMMLGTVGHLDEDTDYLIREGKVSHVTRKLWVDENGVGMGEVDVLDTRVGRDLNTIMAAGCKMSVSSKGSGAYKGRDGAGNDIVERLRLQRFDFVADPGYLDAKPELVEALNESLKASASTDSLQDIMEAIMSNNKLIEHNDKGENDMDPKLQEALIRENVTLKTELDTITTALEGKTAELGALDTLKTVSETLQADNTALKTQVEESTGKVAELDKVFEELGSPEKIKEALIAAKAMKDAFGEFGGVEAAVESLKAGIATDEALKELGSPEKIKEALLIAKDHMTAVEELGTVESIKKALTRAKAFIGKSIAEGTDTLATQLAAEHGTDKDNVLEMLEEMGEAKTSKILSGFSGKEPHHYGKKTVESVKKKADENKGFYDKTHTLPSLAAPEVGKGIAAKA